MTKFYNKILFNPDKLNNNKVYRIEFEIKQDNKTINNNYNSEVTLYCNKMFIRTNPLNGNVYVTRYEQINNNSNILRIREVQALHFSNFLYGGYNNE